MRKMRWLGKDWAKGLMKDTDPRVARAAAAHVGKTYEHRVQPEDDGRRRLRTKPFDTAWTPMLAYALGLMATDGNVAKIGQNVTVVSGDVQLLEAFKQCVPRAGRICRHGENAFHVNVSSVILCSWLATVGIFPAKSLTIGSLKVPDEFFFDVARGLLDGDEGIDNYIHHPGGNESATRTIATNASTPSFSRRAVTIWRGSDQQCAGCSGSTRRSSVNRSDDRRRACTRLRYGKHASLRILSRLYADPQRSLSRAEAEHLDGLPETPAAKLSTEAPE